MRIGRFKACGTLALASIVVLAAGRAEGQEAEAARPAQVNAVRYVVPLGDRPAVVVATGRKFTMPTQRVWKPFCATGAELVTVEDLRSADLTHQAAFADPTKVTVVDRTAPDAGLNIVFALAGSVPSGAVSAFAAAESYLEAEFPSDTITVNISVSFVPLPPGVIGSTASTFGAADWPTSQNLLTTGMDSSDSIQLFLPVGTLPVRYTASTTTNENQAFWTLANFKAAGGAVSGADADMQFSTLFPFDFNPGDGVSSSSISLQDVIVHEVGHALGFTSGVDFRTNDIDIFDAFRFRFTDGASDFNPDDTAEFTARPRWAVKNSPDDDVTFDDITTEIRLSDGSPFQASHWREQTSPVIGIMDPAIGMGETFYPNFFHITEITAFDAIGWDGKYSCPEAGRGFLPPATWSPAGVGNLTWFPGDYNGDGRTDMARWQSSIGLEVLRSTGSSFASAATWSPAGVGDLTWFPGDYNGDGRTDMARWRSSVGLEVLISTGSSFVNAVTWSPAGVGNLTWFPGDYNGDGKTDMARWRSGVGLEVLISTGSSFANAVTWSPAGVGTLTWFPGDYNGDGKTDMARWQTSVGIEVLRSTGTSFVTAATWSPAGVGNRTWFPGDYNGDGEDDMCRWFVESGVDVLTSTGSSFNTAETWSCAGAGDLALFPGDYDGDGKTDIARWINTIGIQVLRSTGRLGICKADLNDDGVVDFPDYLDFLSLYDASDARADFTRDGTIDFGDYLEFLNHFDAGC